MALGPDLKRHITFHHLTKVPSANPLSSLHLIERIYEWFTKMVN
jgi:hypothetical protein